MAFTVKELTQGHWMLQRTLLEHEPLPNAQHPVPSHAPSFIVLLALSSIGPLISGDPSTPHSSFSSHGAKR